MTNGLRAAVWVLWLAAVGWLWYAGAIGTTGALVAAAASLVLLALPVPEARRRRSALQYVEVGKQPVGLF